MKKIVLCNSMRAGAVCALLVGFFTAGTANAVPSFARQTGMACQSCHTVFPELTPFGRSFKLNAYTIDNLPQVQGITASKDMELLLNQIPPLSIMFQTSYTSTKSALPDSVVAGANSQNGQVLFPQQASLFYAGRVAPNLGAFVQITYASDTGTFALDNTEFRYAKQVPAVADGLTYGFTMNNNPTVQDVWNSTPAWQTPFDQKTSAAPVPAAATQIDGVLSGGVAGLTGYLWWRNSIYAELGLYRSSPQGFKGTAGAGPLDSTAGGVISGWAPYWRVAYERQWDRNSWSIGAYGITAKIIPATQPLSANFDRFNDVALDSQYQFIGDEHIVSIQGTYINERQSLDGSLALAAPGAENQRNHLDTFRIGGSYYLRRTYGGALGYFSTTGSEDAVRYAPAALVGFANNKPNSNGWIAELDYLPWQNVKVALQYVAYQKFNGGSTNYDGAGRNASDNNTMYLLAWLNF
ncbi:MAG TPA: cytochrome C [Burkholderiales bacterium]